MTDPVLMLGEVLQTSHGAVWFAANPPLQPSRQHGSRLIQAGYNARPEPEPALETLNMLATRDERKIAVLDNLRRLGRSDLAVIRASRPWV